MSGIERAKALVREVPHLDCYETSALLGGAPTPHFLRLLRAQGKLLGIRYARIGYLYPQFQFDEHARRIHPCVATTNQVLLSSIGLGAALQWWFDEAIDDVPAHTLVGTPNQRLVIKTARCQAFSGVRSA